MNVIDSSAWIEYFGGAPNAKHFARVIEAPDLLLVPSITLLEVFKRVCQQRDEASALQCIAMMQESPVVDLDAALSLRAAALGLRHKLLLAESIVYATARQADALLWTQDPDFEHLPGVRFWRRA